jgi:single-strand DNA-binding protein
MANLNRVMLIGRLTRDPESRRTQTGSVVVNFGLAVNRTYRKRDSEERVEETTFIDVEAWDRTGETFARYTRKGSQVYVEGRLKLDQWEKDGKKFSKLRVVMEEFQFLDAKGSGGGGGGDERSFSRRPAPAAAGAGGAAGGGAPGGGKASGGEETPQDDYAQFDDDIPF